MRAERRGPILDGSYPLIFLYPTLAVFTLFFVAPAVLGLVISLTDESLVSEGSHFVGLENYRFLLSEGSVFLTALGNQIKFALVNTILKTGVGLLFALVLNERFRGRNFLRALVYMPIMVSPVVLSLIFNYILKPEGFVNKILRSAGLGLLAQDWFGNFDLALYTVAAVDTWIGVGWTVLIMLAALQSIPQEVVECAKIDGARAITLFFRIKLHFILHAVNFCFLLTIISGMKAFDIIYALTGGGPGRATEVIGTFMAKSLASGSLGYPAAINFLQFLIVTVVALAINRLNEWNEGRL